jgi:FlaA1/EpsC-like NDP-sugar epimerase
VGDILDDATLDRVFKERRPEVVYHAAAYKHVPLMEDNPQAAILNNVLGTKAVADAADRWNVQRYVQISTDKAVRPSSVMGATKLMAERYVQALSQSSKTSFGIVRFGNVLNSIGSVVPTFRRQIEQGGPITVTDPEMKRFFMTIPEAVQLVIQAGAIGPSGHVMILDMGEPVKIVDLAKDLILLSGLRYPDDIDIVFSGIRPGEKLEEELFYPSESGAKPIHDKIFCSAAPTGLAMISVLADINRLENACGGRADDARNTLREVAEGHADKTWLAAPKTRAA